MTYACPDCPFCGNPPKMSLGASGFCGTEGCDVLSWNLTITHAENMASLHKADPWNGHDE